VHVSVTDQGNPEKTSQAMLSVTISRDMYPPEFTGDYDQTVMANHPINGTVVTTVRANDRDLKVSV